MVPGPIELLILAAIGIFFFGAVIAAIVLVIRK